MSQNDITWTAPFYYMYNGNGGNGVFVKEGGILQGSGRINATVGQTLDWHQS